MHRDSLCYYRGMENLRFERTHYHVHNMQRAVQNIPINSNYPKAPSKYPINGHPLFLHASDIYIWGRSFRITILSCTGRSGYKLHRSTLEISFWFCWLCCWWEIWIPKDVTFNTSLRKHFQACSKRWCKIKLMLIFREELLGRALLIEAFYNCSIFC